MQLRCPTCGVTVEGPADARTVCTGTAERPHAAASFITPTQLSIDDVAQNHISDRPSF